MIYITIEGLSGSGKSMVLNHGLRHFLQEYFKSSKVLFLAEPFPSTTDLTLSFIEQMYTKSTDLDQSTKYSLLMAARARLFNYVIANYSKEVGADKLVVVSESSMLRAMVVNRSYLPLLSTFHFCKMNQGGFLPNAVIYLNTPPEVINVRKGGTPTDSRVKTINDAHEAYINAMRILYDESSQKAKIHSQPVCLQTPEGYVDMPIEHIVMGCVEAIKAWFPSPEPAR